MKLLGFFLFEIFAILGIIILADNCDKVPLPPNSAALVFLLFLPFVHQTKPLPKQGENMMIFLEVKVELNCFCCTHKKIKYYIPIVVHCVSTNVQDCVVPVTNWCLDQRNYQYIKYSGSSFRCL